MKKSPPPGFTPSPGSLAALVALGGLAALLSLFLWSELLLARAGGATACALSDPNACAELWNGPFAKAIHRYTGLPIAGWGLAWALCATALPLLALRQAAEGAPRVAWLSAMRITSAAGLVATLVLMATVLQARAYCLGCIGTYLLVFAYSGIALLAWRPLGLPERDRGLFLSAAATVAAFGILLYPGLKTASSSGNTAGREALAGAGSVAAPAPTRVPEDEVSRFVASLAPGLRQTLSDSLHIYNRGSVIPLSPARALQGPADAPLRITDFTDIRCGHCAELHETLASLGREARAGSFSVEPRQFPLDGACNPYIRQSSDPVRCLAARARICVEGRPGATEYAARLFARRGTLTAAEVYALADGLVSRPRLEACVASPETQAKLRADVDLAARYEIDGTPLVLLNGRKGTSFPPFLYAMILTGGRSDHPAFGNLPAPNPSAHLH
jgi:serine/threonine-protein kinase